MKWLQKIRDKIQVITNFILLHLVYFIGIGISSIIAKLVGKHFLETKPEKSTWKKYSGSKGLETMF